MWRWYSVKYTTNYNLKKPEYTEGADIKDINDNMDTIDSALEGVVTATDEIPASPLPREADRLEGHPASYFAKESDRIAHEADYTTQIPYATTSGSANTYTVSTNPALPDLVAGVAISVKIHGQNTGASTLNWNGKGAKAIKKANGADVGSGNLKLDGVYTLRYDGVNFILQGEGGEYGTASPNDVRSTKTVGTESGVEQGTLDLTNLTSINLKKNVVVDGVTGKLYSTTLTAGEVEVIASNTQKNTDATAYTKIKEIQIFQSATSIRVSFDYGSWVNGQQVAARVYINDSPVGIERLTTSGSTVTVTEDFSNINIDDKIQIFAKRIGTAQCAVNNLKIKATSVPSLYGNDILG